MVQAIKPSEDLSYWTLEDNKEVTVLLQKVNDMEWWKCVIEGDVSFHCVRALVQDHYGVGYIYQ